MRASKPGLDLAPHLSRIHRTEWCMAVHAPGAIYIEQENTLEPGREGERERGNDNVEGRGGLGGRRSRRRPSNPVFTFIRSLARVAHIHIFISTPFLHPLGGYTRICSRHGGSVRWYTCVRVKRTPRSNVTVFHVDARGSAVP